MLLKYNGKILKTAGGAVISSAQAPAGIPAKTVRFDFKYDHFDPTTMVDSGGIGATWTHVEADVYDFHYDNSNWGSRSWGNGAGNGGIFNTYYHYRDGYIMNQHVFDLVEMNLEGIIDVSSFLASAYQANSLGIIRNTGSITNFTRFLAHGSRIMLYTSIPLFDTSSASDVRNMFYNARNVTTGALALYQQMLTQANPPTSYSNCFSSCGSNTVTGAAELAQIPTTWGGTME